MSPRIKICKEAGCKSEQTIEGYCRLHYLKSWKKVREEKKKKSLRALNRYVDNIIKQNPDKYVENLKDNLRNPLDFESKDYSSPLFQDEFDTIMEELEFKQDLDQLLNRIKVDKSF